MHVQGREMKVQVYASRLLGFRVICLGTNIWSSCRLQLASHKLQYAGVESQQGRGSGGLPSAAHEKNLG